MADNTEYSSDTGGVISFLSHEVYQGAWDHRGGEPFSAMFSTNNEDLSLQDESGKEVLKISGGKMRSLREDVIPIRVTDGEGSGYARECWIKPGTYRVINEDPDCELSFAFTGEKSEIEVQTESEEAVVTLDEEEDVQKVQIVEEEKSFLVKLSNFIQEILIRAISATGSALIQNMLGKLLLRFIAFDDVETFQIDGEDADVREFLEQIAEENEEEEEELVLSNQRPDAPAADEGPADPDPA